MSEYSFAPELIRIFEYSNHSLETLLLTELHFMWSGLLKVSKIDGLSLAAVFVIVNFWRAFLYVQFDKLSLVYQSIWQVVT